MWQQLQIEPSAAWHQDVKAQDPYIYHYTFGVEYNVDGTPVVGGKGAWSAGGFPGLTSRRIPPHLPGGSQGSGPGRSYRSQSTS